MAAAAAVSGAKRSLRAELKQRLRAISAEERLRQSRLLTQKVIAHRQYQKSQRISIFLSMPDEIETEEIIKDIFQQGKVCFIPRYRLQSNHMDMVKLASADEISSLPKTSWNIHQPSESDTREEALATGGLDLIFMPGLGLCPLLLLLLLRHPFFACCSGAEFTLPLLALGTPAWSGDQRLILLRASLC
uniref:5-formyltetrahydrofolate cyclo-ligase n=1 Tax=Oryctolagus cuniculus TaxID=9986 RepID=A0A5F9DS89_RABIT